MNFKIQINHEDKDCICILERTFIAAAVFLISRLIKNDRYHNFTHIDIFLEDFYLFLFFMKVFIVNLSYQKKMNAIFIFHDFIFSEVLPFHFKNKFLNFIWKNY